MARTPVVDEDRPGPSLHEGPRRALVVGRFQPFHNGHLALVRHALEVAERHGEVRAVTPASAPRGPEGRAEVVLVLGSAEASHTPENPFTAGERHEMVRAALAAEGGDLLARVVVVTVPDLHRNALWVRHVESLAPPFDVVLTNNPLPRLLFSEAGYAVEPFPLFERGTCEGRTLRARMADDGDWEPFVPKAVAELVRRFRGPERLRALRGTDRVAAGQA